MQRVKVQLATPYELVIDSDRGAEARMAAELTALLPKAFGLVSDSNVGPLHAARIRQALEAEGAQVAYVEVAAGESSKSLATVEKVAQALVSAGVTRASALSTG